MPERPEPVRDLDWPAERARALADGAEEMELLLDVAGDHATRLEGRR